MNGDIKCVICKEVIKSSTSIVMCNSCKDAYRKKVSQQLV